MARGCNASTNVFLTEELFHTHLAIFGGTRQGKSKLFEQICRQLIGLGRGFCFIDPHSDTADDILAFLASRAGSLGLYRDNIHYINPDEQLFAFDPFFYAPTKRQIDGDPEAAYRKWLHAKVLDVERILTRSLGETEAEAKKQVRLHRWMRSVLYAVGIRHSVNGEHLPLSDALILLNPDHDRYREVFETVAPLLDNEDGHAVLSDLEMIGRIKNPLQREQWSESTMNRLREILSPIIRRIFSPHATRIDFRKIIANGGIILASLGKKEGFHQNDGHVIGGLLIRELFDAMMTTDRHERSRYYLFVDEAHNFLGDDMVHLFKESGKFQLSIGIAVQSLDNLRSGDIDLVPTVLGMCGLRITFQQQFFPFAEDIGKSLAHPLVDFTPLIQEVQQHSHYEFLVTPSVGVSTSQGQSEQWSQTNTKGLSYTHTTGTATGAQNARGISNQSGAANAVSEPDRFDSGNRRLTRTNNEASGTQQTETSSVVDTDSSSNTESSSESEGHSVGKQGSVSNSVTLSLSPLAQHKLVEQETGSLKRSIDWQDRQITNDLQLMPKQHCLLSIGPLGVAMYLRVATVESAFETSGSWSDGVVAGFKQHIYQTHDYYSDFLLAVPEENVASEPQQQSPFS